MKQALGRRLGSVFGSMCHVLVGKCRWSVSLMILFDKELLLLFVACFFFVYFFLSGGGGEEDAQFRLRFRLDHFIWRNCNLLYDLGWLFGLKFDTFHNFLKFRYKVILNSQDEGQKLIPQIPMVCFCSVSYSTFFGSILCIELQQISIYHM